MRGTTSGCSVIGRTTRTRIRSCYQNYTFIDGSFDLGISSHHFAALGLPGPRCRIGNRVARQEHISKKDLRGPCACDHEVEKSGMLVDDGEDM